MEKKDPDSPWQRLALSYLRSLSEIILFVFCLFCLFCRNQPLAFICLKVLVDLSYFQKSHIQISTIISGEVRGNFARNTPLTPHDSLLVYWHCGEFHGRYMVYIRGTSVNKMSPNILNQSILFFRWEPPAGSVTKGWALINIAGIGVGVFSIKNWPNLKEIGKTFSSGNFER